MKTLFFFMLPKLEFNDEHFLQMSGVPMGWKSSGSICNLVVHELEKNILQSPIYKHTLYRYVNNTLVFWTGSLEQQKDCVPFVNTLHRRLKFSYEASVQSIQFLDLALGTDWKRQAPWISNAIQRRRNWTILAQIFMPPTTYLRWLPLRWNHTLCEKQQQSWHIWQKEIKISSWRNFQPEDATKLRLCEAIFSINFEDRQHLIQEKT